MAKTVSVSTTYSYYSQEGQLLGTYANGDYTDYYYLGREMVARYGDSTQSDAPGYTGHVEDDDLGLVYVQQRYYAANIGRFYSNDPVGSVGHLNQGNIQGFNRYAYANNNPYKYTDPNGENPVCFTPWTALACIGVAAAGYGVYKFGEKTEDLKNSKLREMEADRLRQEAYINCVRSGGRDCGGIASSERELAERRRDTLEDAAATAEAGCIVGTTCGGSIPSSTEENAVNGLGAIWNWITGGDEQEEQEPPEHPEQEEGR
ncbi:RHS repeat-associated core domain-containing protein [Pseudidiomarina terrestris]|nr:MULTISPECIES: RHS repeat-associated core domain-containing protein [unclassified Pseudidiomarina]